MTRNIRLARIAEIAGYAGVLLGVFALLSMGMSGGKYFDVTWANAALSSNKGTVGP